MLLHGLTEASQALAATRSRKKKVSILAEVLTSLDDAELPVGVAYLAGELPQGRLGVGYSTLGSLQVEPATDPSLAVIEVHRRLDDLAATSGPGSQADRLGQLESLYRAATAAEQRFLSGLLSGEVRHGALGGIMVEAIASAYGVPAPRVRRAAMLNGDLAEVATIARHGGEDGLGAVGLTLFRPIRPMLATTAQSVVEAVESFGEAIVEWKVDGARVQIHRSGDRVEVYTRSLREITGQVAGVVAATQSLPVRSIVLDAEVVAIRDDGRPRPFQETMQRFATEDDSSMRVGELGIYVFDCLHLDGEDLIDLPAVERYERWSPVVPDYLRMPRRVITDLAEAEEVLEEAVSRGHEGVMVKAPQSTYTAGRRGSEWLKVKPVHTLDLVVLAVEWGSGRRRGWLSNLHLGASNPEAGGFVMLGKTFKGLTDEMLEWQTKRFLELETHRDGHVVFVKPEQVVEIAFDGVQTSRRYPGGVTLRFARVRGYRHDKTADEADTIDAVREIHQRHLA